MSRLKQQVLSFGSESYDNSEKQGSNTIKDTIKKIRNKIRENSKRQSNNQKNLIKRKSVLPEEGYLYTKELNTTDNKELQKAVRAIRGNIEMKFIPSDTFLLYDELIQIKNEERKTKIKNDEDRNLIGDPIKLNKKWPTNSKRIRVTFHNTGGIGCGDNMYEGHIYNQDFMRIQSDITCFAELNVNLNNYKIRNDLKNVFKLGDKHSKVFLSSQPEKEVTNYGYLPGGNAMAIRGTLSGRVLSGGGDKYGRWSFTKIKCKGPRDLFIISAYWPVGNLKGDLTISSQQYRAYIESGEHNPKEIRQIFIRDLKKFIDSNNEENSSTLLLIDGNVDVQSKEVKNLCCQMGMYIVKPESVDNLPRTHERGSKCIDFALASNELREIITSSGFLPFYAVGMSDHRAIYVDLDYQQLFKGLREDKTTRPTGTFTTKKISL